MIVRLAERLSAAPGLVVTGIGALFAVAYLTAIAAFPKADGRIVIGDAVHHYVQLRSLVHDSDLDLANDYARVYGFEVSSAEGRAWIEPRLTPTGRVRTLMPIGPALAWMPAYVAAWLAGGSERVREAMPGLTGIAATTLAAWLMISTAMRLADRSAALVGVVGTWVGSHAIYYSLISPAYSHAMSMLATSLVVAHWSRARSRWRLGPAVVSGALVGIAALMRWQDAVWLAVPAIEALRAEATAARRIGWGVASALAAVAAFSPQMLVWQALYGQPFAIPQGASFMEWTSPNLIAVLFSDNHGLFTWTPMVLLSVIGGWSLCRRHRWAAAPVAAVVLSSWYVNAAVSDWWAGEAYGARRFLSLFPFMALGLAAFVAPRGTTRPRRVLAVVALAAANALLLLQYQAFMRGLRELAPYPRGVVDLFLMRFVVPFRLLFPLQFRR